MNRGTSFVNVIMEDSNTYVGKKVVGETAMEDHGIDSQNETSLSTLLKIIL